MYLKKISLLKYIVFNSNVEKNFYQRINGISLGFFFIMSGHVTLGFSKLSFFLK